MATESIEASWEPEPTDYRALLPKSRRRTTVLILSVPAGVAGMTLGYLDTGPLADTLLILGLLVTLLALFMLTLLPRLLVQMHWGRNSLARVPVRVTASAGAGVLIARPHTTSEYRWAAFTEWQETPDLFWLRVGEGDSAPKLLIPKRGLASPDRVDRLRSLLRSEVAPERHGSADRE